MSISFSGLASGLDTASWVTSLTQLRQAKVTKLEEQKQTVATAQATLQGIRSFFASFRSSLEKITDSKFKVSSMDIFSKKIAEVSNAAVLSATAKSNAAEGSYEVKVNNTATQTQVKSGYRYRTTLVSTTQATTNSYLRNVGIGYGTNPESGVHAGNIEITHNDVTSTISISANETMNSFLDKLHAVGIEADFNNETGIFSIGVNVGDINDVGNTNILSKLKINDINYGYTCEQLKKEDEHEEYTQATSDTLLSDLGVSAGTISIHTANGDYELTLEDDDTIGSLVNALRSQGIEATFSEGVFSINNALITDDGTTGLIEHFGLENPSIASQTQESGGLTYQTVYTSTTTAGLDTLLKDIEGITLEGDETIKVQNAAGNITTITVGVNTTIGDMVSDMNDAGLGASLTQNGILKIDNGFIIEGGTFDVESAFGLQYTGVAQTVTGSALTVTTTTISGATNDTKLKDLTTAVTSGTIKVTDTTDNVHNLVINENDTIGDVVQRIRDLGLGASFDNTTGVLTLTGGSYTTEGLAAGSASNFLEVFFGQNTLTPNTIDSASSTSQALRESVLNTHSAEGTTTLGELGMLAGTYTATFKNGATEAEIQINENTTINGLVQALRDGGINAAFDSGNHNIVINEGEFLGVTGGNFDTIMNFSESIIGKYATSDIIKAQTVTVGSELTSSSTVNHNVYTTTTSEQTVITPQASVSQSGTVTYNTVNNIDGTTATVGQTSTSSTVYEVTTSANTQTGATLGYDVIIPGGASSTETTGQAVTSGSIITGNTTPVSQSSGTLTYTQTSVTNGSTETVAIGTTQTSTVTYTTTELDPGHIDTIKADGSSQTSTLNVVETITTPGTLTTTAVNGSQQTDPLTYITTEMSAGTTTMSVGTQTTTISMVETTELVGGTTSGITTTMVSSTLYCTQTIGTTSVYALGTIGNQAIIQTQGSVGIEQTSNTFAIESTIGQQHTQYITNFSGNTVNINQTLGNINRDATADFCVMYSDGHTETFAYTTTIAQLITALNSATSEGNVTFNNSYISVNNNNSGDTPTILQMGYGQIEHLNQKKFGTINVSTTTTLIDGTTTLTDAGYSPTRSSAILLSNGNGIQIQDSTTFNDLVSNLESNGVTASYENGVLTVGSQSDTTYITNIDLRTAAFLGISAGEGASYNSNGTINRTMTSATTLGELNQQGQNGSYAFKTYDGTIHSFTSTNTVGDVISEMQALGYSVSLIDGKLAIDPLKSIQTGNIITKFDENLCHALHMTPDLTISGEGYTYVEGNADTTCSSLTAKWKFYDPDGTLSLTATLGNLGVYGCIIDATNGNSITVTDSMTLGQLLHSVQTMGVSMTIAGDSNTIDWNSSGTYEEISVHFTGGQNVAISNIDMQYFNPESPISPTKFGYGRSFTYSDPFPANSTITSRNTLADFGWGADEYGYIVYNDGVTHRVDSTMAFDDLAYFMSRNGMTTSLNNGQFTFSGNDSSLYFTYISDNLLNFFGGTLDYGEGITYNTSGGYYQTVTSLATGTTTLGELGLTHDAVVELYHYSYSNQKTPYHTVTFGTDTTLYEMQENEFFGEYASNANFYYVNSGARLDAINNSGTIPTGATELNFTLNYDPNSHITYIDEDLANILHLDYTTTVTGQTPQETTNTATGTTTFGTLGLTAQATITTDTGIVTVNTDTTIDDLADDLYNNHDIWAIFSDYNGRLTIGSYSNDHYIVSMDEALSNILTGINVGEGHTYNTSGSPGNSTTTTTPATGSTTMTDLGALFRRTDITDNQGNTLTVYDYTDLDTLVSNLNNLGITSSITGNVLTIGDEGDTNFITNISPELASILGIEAGEGSTYELNTINPSLYTSVHTATTETTLGQLGLSGSGGSFTLNNGTVINVTANTSIGSLVSDLAAAGIESAYFSNGVFTVGDEEDTNFITRISPNVAAVLGIDAGEGITYNVNTQNANISNTTTTVDTTVTMAQLGMNSSGTITLSNGNVINVSTSDTIGDIFNALNNTSPNSITCSLTNGVITIGNSGDPNYITAMSSNIAAALGIEAGAGHSYNVNGVTASTSSTLSDIGMSGDSARITTDYSTIDLTSTSTIQDVLDALNDSGNGLNATFTDGVLSISPANSHYLKSMSSNLASALNIQVGYGESYEVQTNFGEDSSTVHHDATLETTMQQLGLTTNNGKIVTSAGDTINVLRTDSIESLIGKLGAVGITATINAEHTFVLGDENNDTNCVVSISETLSDILGVYAGDGDSYTTSSAVASTTSKLSDIGMTGESARIKTDYSTIDLTSTSTIQDVLDALNDNGNGLNAAFEDGILTIAPANGHYLRSISSNLADALNINTGYGETFNVVIEGGTNETVPVIATTETALSTLGLTQRGTIITDTNTVNIETTDTIASLMNKLEAVGISSDYDEDTGIFSLGSTTDEHYVKNISTQLARILGNIDVGEGYTYNNISNTETIYETTVTQQTIDSSCTFGEFGVTAEGGVINLSNGQTVTVNANTTVASFITDMSGKGIDVYLNNGTFTLQPQEGVHIDGCTGQNILNAMNIFGSTYTTSNLTLGNTKLKDLKDSEGNSLGITSGTITAYKNGIANNISIDNNATLDELAVQLSGYNISLSYGSGSIGRITVSGAGDSYLDETAEGSNLLTALGISSWDETKKTASEALSYTTGSNNVINGDTKLVNLKDSAGNSLGITEGRYKVRANGINYEGTIDETTSVNDFLTDLSRYGISGSINSNGQITIQTTNDDTYLVNANGAEGYSNIVDTLFPSWTYGNIYTSGSMDVTETSTTNMTSETKLKDIDQGTYVPGKFIVSSSQSGDTVIQLNENSTVGDVMAALSYHGFNSYIENGRLIIRNDGYTTLKNYTVPSESSNVIDLLGLDTTQWEQPGYYIGSAQSEIINNTVLEAATLNTTLANLRDSEGNSLGITTGEYIIHSNGITHNVNLTSTDITLNSFINTLAGYGINAIFDTQGGQSILKIVGNGDSYLETSEAEGASNVVEKLFGNEGPSSLYNYSAYEQTTELVSTTVVASLGTMVSEYDNGDNKSEGILALTVDGNYSEINITSYETFGSLLEKFERAGVQASMENGIIRLETGNKTFEIDEAHTTSHLVDNLGLLFSNNLGGFAASSDSVTQTTTTIEDRTLSVAKYADYDTQLGLLNISSGTLSIYRNGAKKLINIDNTETFSQFRSRINDAFADVDIDFENGKLRFFSTTEGVDVQVGSSNDTSNISSICGFSQDENGYIISARELYKVNASSIITNSGLFRYGDVTEGTFIIGDETFTINSDTTIQNIIAQINSSEKANASAYWDSVDGKLVISARNTGASMVNIEAGTSNFTDILGLTNSEWNEDGTLNITRIRLDSQEIGQNAKFTINGTNFQSASNIVTSDVSRIQGLTLNLKSSSMGDTVTVTIGKDSEAVTEAVGEFIESYNELVENVDAELSSTGVLKDQNTLKFIKQQIRNLLVNTFAGSTTFRNLAALGISTSSGNSVGLDTSNAGIEYLYFDAEKFMEGYNKDADAVKNMLVGSDETPGILIQIENIVENALATGTGYFSTADKSYTDKITSINEKIRKANLAIEAYRARLESKFQSMDMLISQMQNQYNSFLNTGTKT